MITTEDGDRQNMFAKEPPVYLDPAYTMPHNEKAEKLNGRAAMCGIICAFVSYALTGKLFFGTW